MKVWVNSQNKRIGRPPSYYTSNITDERLAAEQADNGIRQVDAPDCQDKYWRPFDGECFPEMSQAEKDAVDAAEAQAAADAEQARLDAIAAAEAERLALRNAIVGLPQKQALEALFDMISPEYKI